MSDEADGAAAAEGLLPLVYAQLRKLAGGYLRGSPHTLQPTALVHEAWMRLSRDEPGRIRDRNHFVAVAAMAMRQILTDHARRKHAQKRGGEDVRVTLDGSALASPGAAGEARALDVLAVNEALVKLAELNPRQARIVELLFFGGLQVDEVAAVLEVSKSLVEKDWRQARAWLSREMAAAQTTE